MKKNIVTITILFVCSCMQSLYSNTLQGKVIYVNKIDLRHVDSIDEDKKIELQHSMTRSIRTKLESMGFTTVSLDDFK